MNDVVEIVNERIFAVDRATLFDAFADPAKLARWWGPHGFSNRIDEFDFKPGGSWRITMTASDGTDFDNHSTFRAVVAPERIVFVHHLPMHVYEMEMTFSLAQDGTRLHWRMLFEPNEENRRLKTFIKAANEQNFDRLAAVLAQSEKEA